MCTIPQKQKLLHSQNQLFTVGSNLKLTIFYENVYKNQVNQYTFNIVRDTTNVKVNQINLLADQEEFVYSLHHDEINTDLTRCSYKSV